MIRRSCPADRTARRDPASRLHAATIGRITRFLSRQAARPDGLAGRALSRIWVTETAAVNDTAIDLLQIRPGERIVEIGFGPGRTLGRLAAVGAHATGVDVSPTMIDTAARRNHAAIAAGHVLLHHGDGITLPLPDNTADAVLGVHTIYFWPDPPTTLAEIARVLRPGGRIVLAFRTADQPLPGRFDTTVYHVPTTDQATTWLQAAGLTDIHPHRRPDTAPTVTWLAATKPANR